VTSDNRRQLEQVVQLQSATNAYRYGVRSGIPALDADLQRRKIEGPPVGAHDMVAQHAHAEYELLRALLRVYGDDLLSAVYFGPCLTSVAQQGVGAFLRRVLIGESARAAELVAMLAEGRVEFVRLAQRYPRLLVEDAQTYWQDFRART
jgi:hypothetical protein